MSSFTLAGDLSERKKAVLDRLNSSKQDENAPILLIMGNEAGDTDSMSSAILSSYLLSKAISEGNQKYADTFPKSTIIAPLVQQDKRDLPLRAENQFLLSLLNISQDSLLFMDDLPKMGVLAQRSDLLLGLVDHPKLSSTWQPYNTFDKLVQVVIDHHADDGAHKDAKIRVLRGPENGAIGSAASVVVDIFNGTPQLKQLPASLADIALAAILIDTDNLRPAPRGKATEVDLEAANVLLERSTFGSAQRSSFVQTAIQVSGLEKFSSSTIQADMEEQGELHVSQADTKTVLQAATQYFEILSEKKLDVSRLDTHDLLRRDYKESIAELGTSSTDSIRAGFSSVPVGLSDWIHERHGDGEDRWNGYWKALREWMNERKLDVAVVGTSFRELAETGTLEERKKNGKHRRELVLAYLEKPSKGQNLFPGLVKGLEEDAYSASLGGDESQKLELEAPWKGSRRVESTGKRERVGGLEKDGQCPILNESDAKVWIAVWRQRNARASRKIYLPAVLHSLKLASGSRIK
ncbi:hypothetical protein L7F22_003155 [Adiantum nelumboides]|nr:hypothetical protein [Adiantum nelumboides]